MDNIINDNVSLFNDFLVLSKSLRCCPIRPFRIILERLDGLEAQKIKTTQESEPCDIKLEDNFYFSTQSDVIDGTVEKGMLNTCSK